MSPLDSWLVVVILVLAALLAVTIANWRQAERDLADSDHELAMVKHDLEVALGWSSPDCSPHAYCRGGDTHATAIPYGVEPRPLLQLIPGGDQ